MIISAIFFGGGIGFFVVVYFFLFKNFHSIVFRETLLSCFQTGSYSIAKAGLELTAQLLPPPS